MVCFARKLKSFSIEHSYPTEPESVLVLVFLASLTTLILISFLLSLVLCRRNKARKNIQSFRRAVHYTKNENYPQPLSSLPNLKIIFKAVIGPLMGKPLSRNALRSSRTAGKLLHNDLESGRRKTEKFVHVDANIRGAKVLYLH